eukprot:scaffold232702_cov35-Tisochrysis_lutea.AAC.1
MRASASMHTSNHRLSIVDWLAHNTQPATCPRPSPHPHPPFLPRRHSPNSRSPPQLLVVGGGQWAAPLGASCRVGHVGTTVPVV